MENVPSSVLSIIHSVIHNCRISFLCAEKELLYILLTWYCRSRKTSSWVRSISSTLSFNWGKESWWFSDDCWRQEKRIVSQMDDSNILARLHISSDRVRNLYGIYLDSYELVCKFCIENKAISIQYVLAFRILSRCRPAAERDEQSSQEEGRMRMNGR